MNNKMNYILILPLILTFLIFCISMLLKSKNIKTRESISPFECGFDPQHTMRSSFSLRFFLITILFLIFDVELSIMLPIPLSMSNNLTWIFSYNFMIFFILTLGLLFEWSQKALIWQWVYI